MSGIKKILYIHPVSGPGGALEFVLRLINDLDKTRFYPKVLCPAEGESSEVFKNNGIEVVIEKKIKIFGHSTAVWYPITRILQMVRDFIYIFISAIAVYRFIKREKPDLVHLDSSVLIGPALGAKIERVPIVWHIQEYMHDGYFGIRKKIITDIIDNMSSAIIAVTKRDAHRLKCSKKVIVMYNPVEFDLFNKNNIDGKKFKEEFHISDNEKCVAMFGGIAQIKGTLQFVEAALEILKEHENVKFFVFGCQVYESSTKTLKGKIKFVINKILHNESYHSKVKRMITEHEIDDNVVLVGYRRDVPNIMAGLDVILFPSTVPHAAIPIAEAGAMAKPVIASNWGKPEEPDESVVDGVTGILVPPGDSEALAKAIVKILTCPELARKMGEEGYERARELFDAHRYAAKVMKIYDDILEI